MILINREIVYIDANHDRQIDTMFDPKTGLTYNYYSRINHQHLMSVINKHEKVLEEEKKKQEKHAPKR